VTSSEARISANVIGALIGGFATGAAVAFLLWQFV
jgi:hypothetical protein